MEKEILFSLIIGTLNRPKILDVCLNNLMKQTYKKFEIIVIDQSDDDKTEQMVRKFDDAKIKYKKVNTRGLSRARNIALELASGDYFCLIDDDAEYSNKYLENLTRIIQNEKKTIISGYILDTYSKTGIVDYNKIKNHQRLTLWETIRLCPSAALVFPLSVKQSVGSFDENFGVGAQFGAAEETDFLLRCRRKGYKILFSPDVYVEHPITLGLKNKGCEISIDKVKNYAMGGGALYKKHLIYNKEFTLIPSFIDNIARLFVKRIISRSDVTKARLYGFIKGWKSYKSDE